jgi:hypothetical protein
MTPLANVNWVLINLLTFGIALTVDSKRRLKTYKVLFSAVEIFKKLTVKLILDILTINNLTFSKQFPPTYTYLNA